MSFEDAQAAGGAGRRGLLPYLRFRSFWAMCSGWFAFNIVFYGILTWGPLYLSESKGLDLAGLGWSTFAIMGAGFVGELAGGFLADGLRARGMSTTLAMRLLLGCAGIVVVAALIVLTLVGDPIVAIVLLSTVMFFLRWAGMLWSVPAALAGRENAGIVGGAMGLSGNAAGIVSPLIVGFIVGATGGDYGPALLFFVGAGVVMSVCLGLVLDYGRRLPV